MIMQDAVCAFVSPMDLSALTVQPQALHDVHGNAYPVAGNVVDFIAPALSSMSDRANLDAYNSSQSVEIYRNFLDWLFASFDVSEDQFRRELVTHLRLKPGMKVLIVGCGLGEDIAFVREGVGAAGEIHAQDISKAMVTESARKYAGEATYFSISNALHLPYASHYFDAVFHFGGINLFGDMEQAIHELNRVCKTGGRVAFGDEGIAEHLRDSEYYAVAVNNNKLWSHKPPMHLLPHSARDVQLSYVLGNCFYLIGFTAGEGLPPMNIDIPHKGTRGGSARTRYYGQIEGVTVETRAKLYARAKELNISVHALLEDLLK